MSVHDNVLRLCDYMARAHGYLSEELPDWRCSCSYSGVWAAERGDTTVYARTPYDLTIEAQKATP